MLRISRKIRVTNYEVKNKYDTEIIVLLSEVDNTAFLSFNIVQSYDSIQKSIEHLKHPGSLKRIHVCIDVI